MEKVISIMYELTKSNEGDNASRLNILINGLLSKSINDFNNRHQIIDNSHHDLQLLNTICNWQYSCYKITWLSAFSNESTVCASVGSLIF